MQIFPPDNPWNEDISDRPVHPDSAAIIAGIGADKPLGYNLDMNFVLVPPDQPRVPVRVTEYPAESDPGPFPIPPTRRSRTGRCRATRIAARCRSRA